MKLILATLLLATVSCGGLLLSGQEKTSYDLLKQTKETCSKTLNHEVAAQTKCFPLLTGKEVLVNVRKIEITPTTGGVTLNGRVGGDFYVYCELTKDQSSALMKDPDLINVEQLYNVKGRFSRFTESGVGAAFTLSDCEAAGPVSVK